MIYFNFFCRDLKILRSIRTDFDSMSGSFAIELRETTHFDRKKCFIYYNEFVALSSSKLMPHLANVRAKR